MRSYWAATCRQAPRAGAAPRLRRQPGRDRARLCNRRQSRPPSGRWPGAVGRQSGGAVWLTDDRNANPVQVRPDLHLSAVIQPPAPATANRTANRILCAHNPPSSPPPAAPVTGWCCRPSPWRQCVLATRRGRLYPGAWFARWTGLRFSAGDSTMLVSRGAADTLPLRWNCPREVIACEIV